MDKHTPIIAGPMSAMDTYDMFSNSENLSSMAWAFNDWLEAVKWLTERGAPEETPDGNWNPMVERIKWVIKNGEPI